MSNAMAMADNAIGEEAISNEAIAEAGPTNNAEEASEAPTTDAAPQQIEGFSVECKVEPADPYPEASGSQSNAEEEELRSQPAEDNVEEPKDHVEEPKDNVEEPKRGVKRRASAAFSETAKSETEEFRGFDVVEKQDVALNRVLERLEAELEAEKQGFTPVRTIRATVPSKKAIKRPRTDTVASRPSSGLSSRSEDFSGEGANSSPANRRRTTNDISSPQYRVPMDKGWKRELVYRAALDVNSRRTADIYYHSPKGKKLRSIREVAENLAGTGLTIENFSFSKEPIGIDDPEKEIVRDAKLVRRLDSPLQSPAPITAEGKRVPKPKAPKGATLGEHVSPPAKIKVKSMGSRLSSGSGPSPASKKKGAATENNNSSVWKKPRQTPPAGSGALLASQTTPWTPSGTPEATWTQSQSSEATRSRNTPWTQDSEMFEATWTRSGTPEAPWTQSQSCEANRLTNTNWSQESRSYEATSSSEGINIPSTYCGQLPSTSFTVGMQVPVTFEGYKSGKIAVTQSGLSGQISGSSGQMSGSGHASGSGKAPSPPPLQSRPPVDESPEKAPPQAARPCSLTCGYGVPQLACAACLCLYHPQCANYTYNPKHLFTCKNCRKSSSPPREPPPLLHKSGSVGATTSGPPAPRLVPARPDRVLLRMKVASGGPDGERVWAVTNKPTQTTTKPTPTPVKPTPTPMKPPQPIKTIAPTKTITPPVKKVPTKSKQMTRVNPMASVSVKPNLPQSLALLNGKRFIVVPRSVMQAAKKPEDKKRGRISNGSSSPPEALTPRRRTRQRDDTDHFTPFHAKAKNVVIQIFQYLGMRDLAHAARVCRLWREMATEPQLWKHVRMKNSHVSDWAGLCSALKRHGTRRLDLRKLLLPPSDEQFWDEFAAHIPKADTLERIEMCRCPARAVEAVSRGLPNLRSLSALAIRDALLDPSPLGTLSLLHELRLKSMSGLSLLRDLRPLTALRQLQHLSLTSIKELGGCASDVIGQLENLESLELGECTFRAEFATVLGKLHKLRRLRLERGTAQCAAPALLRALAGLPLLTRLELINIDIKVGFDDALAECKNIQRLLIIPTYVSQSATTNKQVLSGVLRLKDTLTHLMWGVTIELLRVTELFIDQCEQKERPQRDVGECIPVLKPVPGCKIPEHHSVQGPPQVEILPLPTLQRLLNVQMPTTKLKLLRIPFHATWRQSLADFQ